jgi:hypothetical protein
VECVIKFLLLTLFFFTGQGFSQTEIMDDLEVNGRIEAISTSEGSHPCPTMSDAQMLAIAAPSAGDCVYNSTLETWMQYNATDTVWEEMGAGGIDQWETAKDYEIDDLVVESDKIYIALTNHTSGTFATDLAGGDWRVLYTSIGGSSEVDSGFTVEEISVPNGQLTHKGSNVYRIETGDDNILLNPSFEHSTFSTSWDIDDGTEDGVLENTTVADGGQAIKFSPSAETVILHQDSTLYATSLTGQNAVASCQIYSDSSDVYLCSRAAGALVATSDGTNITDCARHSGSGTYEDLNLPFIFNGTSNGVEVVSLDATNATAKSITGNVKVDKCKIKMGSLESSAVVGPWQTFTPTGSWVANTTYTGKFRQVGQNLQVEVLVATSGAPTSATLTINLPSGYTIDTTKMVSSSAEQFLGYGVVNDSGSTFYTAQVDYNNTTSVRLLQSEAASTYVRNIALTQAVPITWGASDTLRVFFTVPVVELNGNVNSYSAPCGASCVDRFTAYIDTTPTATKENVEWVTSVVKSGTNNLLKTLTVPSGIFSVVPNCGCTPIATSTGADLSCKYNQASSTTTSIQFHTSNNGTAEDREISVYCDKQGADFKATRTIQGNFSQFNYNYVFGAGNGGGAITADTTNITFTEVTDTAGAWNGTQYTVPSDGLYSIVGHILFTASLQRYVDLYIGGSLSTRMSAPDTTSNHHFSLTKYFTAGQVLSIRAGSNGGTLSNDSIYHYINIHRVPGQ